MITELTCETTEYNVIPKIENEKTVFVIHENSLIISCLCKNDSVIDQTEISISDAISVARIILLKTGYLKS